MMEKKKEGWGRTEKKKEGEVGDKRRIWTV
jgi:hypothetical protein